MLQGIRASTLTMPPMAHDLSLAGMQKMEGYGADGGSWAWPQPSATHPPSYANVFDAPSSSYAHFTTPLTQPPPPPPRSMARHHSMASSHAAATAAAAAAFNPPPHPARPPMATSMIKAQPAFKPTWNGFLDTTKDAMMVVEASLQGRLGHISRRPHDKERAEMLTSGTVLVYEENASGIKRWTDAVHWSPSRVMNNCLIYRQLVRALKPEEKKTALNPSCGTKRKRKESATMTLTKTGDHLPASSDDEYESGCYDSSSLPAHPELVNKVYANFAQTLTPDQQRRFCGSLVDSYEFKEAGLMKKTVSVKYQGTHHHVISYYSLEDVASGKLKRPHQDPKLADIQPRSDLMHGWKVNPDDEESKDGPIISTYSHSLPPHPLLAPVTPTGTVMPAQQTQPPPPPPSLHLHVPEYWSTTPVSQYTPTHHSPHSFTPPQSATASFPTPRSAHPYHAQQSSPLTYPPPPSALPAYVQPRSPEQYSPVSSSRSQFSTPAAPASQFAAPPSQIARHYSVDQQPQATTTSLYTSHPLPASHYQPTHASSNGQSSPYTLPPTATYDLHIPVVPPNPTVAQPSSLLSAAASQQDTQRRASAPVTMPSFTHPHYPSAPYPHSYFVTDSKHGPDGHHGY